MLVDSEFNRGREHYVIPPSHHLDQFLPHGRFRVTENEENGQKRRNNQSAGESDRFDEDLAEEIAELILEHGPDIARGSGRIIGNATRRIRSVVDVPSRELPVHEELGRRLGGLAGGLSEADRNPLPDINDTAGSFGETVGHAAEAVGNAILAIIEGLANSAGG